MTPRDTMRNGTITSRVLATASLAALLSGSAAGAPQEAPPAPQEKPQQEPKNKPVDPPKKEDKGLRELDPLRGSGGSGPAGASEEEMKELFIKVDKRLKRVSELLFEASTGDSSRSREIGSAGIDELIREAENGSGASAKGIGQILEASRSQSEAARTEIDRILEIAAQSSPSGSGGQGGPPPPSSGMPKQGQTPGGSQREEKGAAPDEQGKKPGEQQQDQQRSGDEPKGGQEQKGGPDGPGTPQPKSETGEASNAVGDEEWGDLPVHLRKTFQNGVSDDVPPRYRDWVDSYYKRLNRRSGK